MWLEKSRAWESEREQIIGDLRSLNDATDEYMHRRVQLIELMQHTEITFKNVTPEKKRRTEEPKIVELVSSNLLLKDGTFRFQ